MNKCVDIIVILTGLLSICVKGFCQESENTSKTNSFMGHKYILVSEGKRWRDANKDAEKMSGHLVTISSSEEQEFIVNFLRSQKNSPFCTWLGFTDDKKEGDWKWVTGEEVKYTNWGPGQPDNGYGCQNFAWIGWFNDGKWDDNLEGTKLPFIVEFDNSSTGKSRGDIESNDLKVYYGGHTYELSEQKKTGLWQSMTQKNVTVI